MDMAKIMQELQTKRDELKLQLHLGSKEVEEEWEELMGKWDKFVTREQFEKTSEEVGEAAREMGLQMKAAYDKLKK